MNHPYRIGDRLDSALFGPRFYRVIKLCEGYIVTETPQGYRFKCTPGSAVYEANRGRPPQGWGGEAPPDPQLDRAEEQEATPTPPTPTPPPEQPRRRRRR